MSSGGSFKGTEDDFKAVLQGLPPAFRAGDLRFGSHGYERAIYELDDGTKVIWYKSAKSGLNFQGRRYAELSQAWQQANNTRIARKAAATTPAATGGATVAIGPSAALSVASAAASALPAPSSAAMISASSSSSNDANFCGCCTFARVSKAHAFCTNCGARF